MSWIKETKPDDIAPDKDYFIAMPLPFRYWFWCRCLNGKETWASKPGIAIRFVGSPELVAKIIDSGGQLVAVEVPADADTRWRARKRRVRR